MDSEALTAKIVLAYVKPTEEERTLREELKTHEFVSLRGLYLPRAQEVGSWYKIKFVCEDSVIVEELELNAGETRFLSHKIYLKDWQNHFVYWMDPSHARFEDARLCWEDGVEMYT